MRLRLNRFHLPTRHPFTIARATTTVQATLIVELEQDGAVGYGEAANVPYYAATVDATAAAIEQARDAIEHFHLSEPGPFWTAMASWVGHSPAAQCALDCAAHDLWGKLART
ncbi:MAG: dipeptide epimerase, partial [Patescibacteria group bacterium]|nr:dipeptide epimerase [Patescibacteria group bacterium]